MYLCTCASIPTLDFSKKKGVQVLYYTLSWPYKRTFEHQVFYVLPENLKINMSLCLFLCTQSSLDQSHFSFLWIFWSNKRLKRHKLGNVGCRVKRIVIGVSNWAPASFGKGKHNNNDNNKNRSIWLSVLCM